MCIAVLMGEFGDNGEITILFVRDKLSCVTQNHGKVADRNIKGS